jgi:hypothetical protein
MSPLQPLGQLVLLDVALSLSGKAPMLGSPSPSLFQQVRRPGRTQLLQFSLYIIADRVPMLRKIISEGVLLALVFRLRVQVSPRESAKIGDLCDQLRKLHMTPLPQTEKRWKRAQLQGASWCLKKCQYSTYFVA